jgi:hypothetical protein
MAAKTHNRLQKNKHKNISKFQQKVLLGLMSFLGTFSKL